MPREVEVKTVLNKTKRRDPWFLDDYTFNPYSSCAFNCLYCYIRGSKYGTNLEESFSVKINAIELLDKQLANRAKKNQYGIIALSSATDPYLKIEKNYQLTRQALEVILKHRFPVHILTKSDLILRDLDLLKEIDQSAILPHGFKELTRGVIVSFSFSTLQDEVAKVFEPGATPPTLRLLALEQTMNAGFLTGVSFMPLLPYISDTTEQLEFAFQTFSDLRINHLFPATITLFGEGKAASKTLMINAIEKHYPDLLDKYQRFFASSHQMPNYYRKAFDQKMREMLEKYGLKNRIY